MGRPFTAFIGAIVVAPDGRLLCQLRDDVPWIICPGTWCCCPGGHLEAEETPEEGVRRELREEFEIEVSLTPMHVHVEHGEEFHGVYHAFLAQLLTPLDAVCCNEGVRVDFFHPDEALRLPQHPVSRLFVQHYVDARRSRGGVRA